MIDNRYFSKPTSGITIIQAPKSKIVDRSLQVAQDMLGMPEYNDRTPENA